MLRLTCLAGLLLLAGGCARRDPTAATGARAGILHVGNGAEIQSLDPHLAGGSVDHNVLSTLFEGLLTLDEETLAPRPGAAERWEVSADGLTYTFHLRRNGRWSNGDPLTARDFLLSFRRALSPGFASEYRDALYPVRGAEAFAKGRVADFAETGFAAPDDHTLVITLAQPAAYFPTVLRANVCFPVHSPSVLRGGAALEDRTGRWTDMRPFVGNGPFRLVEWREQRHLEVERNPHYWDADRVRLKGIRFHPAESTQAQELAFRAGQLHTTWDVPLAKVAAYRRDSPELLRVEPYFESYFIRFNTRHPVLRDARVRRALALAIDREAISRAVFQGTRAAASSFTPPDCGGYNARARITTDVDAARALLAEAGFPAGRGLPVFPVQVQNDSTYPRIMEAIQAMWLKELGVRSTIEPFEQKTWVQNQQSKQHVIGLMGWTGDYPDPLTFLGLFRGDGGNNWTGWASAAYDQLITETERTADAAQRLELFQRAEALLLQEVPVTPLVFGSRTYLIHPSVRGWEPSPLGLHRFQLIELRD